MRHVEAMFEFDNTGEQLERLLRTREVVDDVAGKLQPGVGI